MLCILLNVNLHFRGTSLASSELKKLETNMKQAAEKAFLAACLADSATHKKVVTHFSTVSFEIQWNI
jgi:hypothetical protein